MADQRASDAAGLREIELTTPVSPADLARLEIGNVVYLNGVVYTGREGVYQRTIGDGVEMPPGVSALTNVNFHCSPAAAVRGPGDYHVAAVTATASFRFAKWLPEWFARTGCRVVIGKGGMSAEHYRDIFVPAGAVYLTTVGYGTGALLGRGITGVEAVHWLDDLGIAQAMWVLRVRRFGPFLVESDLAGRSLFEENNRAVNARLAKLYDGLAPPALGRYGETDDKTQELI